MELHQPPPPAPSEIRVSRVESLEDYRNFVRITHEVFGMMERLAEPLQGADEWNYFLEKDKEIYPFRLMRKQFTKLTGDILIDISKVVDVLAGGTPSKFASIVQSENVPSVTDPNSSVDPKVGANSKMSDVQFLTVSTNAAFVPTSEYIEHLELLKKEGIQLYCGFI